MIRKMEVLNAIASALGKSFAERPSYIGRLPSGFDRPSFFIEFMDSFGRDINVNTVERTDYYIISGYEEVEADFGADPEVMINAQDDVLECFKSGKLTVGDRKINVTASAAGRDEDIFYVGLKLEYFDERVKTGKDLDLIEEVEINKTYL